MKTELKVKGLNTSAVPLRRGSIVVVCSVQREERALKRKAMKREKR